MWLNINQYWLIEVIAPMTNCLEEKYARMQILDESNPQNEKGDISQ